MSYQQFVETHRGTWSRTEELLDRLENNEGWDVDQVELPALYRRCCHHLALTRRRRYDARLEDRLHNIALRGYQVLYGRRHTTKRQVWRELVNRSAVDFPRLVRAHAGYFWVSSLLFYGPAIAFGAVVLADPDAVYSLLTVEQVSEYEDMYRTRPTEERGSAADFTMFGYYIYNNISIAYRTFAAGLFAGIGAIFFLVFNGVFFGGITAHMVHVGSAVELTSFVITHGAFELTGLVIAGVAGLRLGSVLIAPGRRNRGDALRHAGKDCATLVLGVTVMLVIAAFVEAFWSSTAAFSPTTKYVSGTVAWLAVAFYLLFAGRSGEGDLGS